MVEYMDKKLGGGFKHLLFSTLLGEIIQFDYIVIFKWVGSTTNQMEISYHYLEDHPMICSKWLITMLIVSPPTGATFPFHMAIPWLINGVDPQPLTSVGMILQVHPPQRCSQKDQPPNLACLWREMQLNFQVRFTKHFEGKIQVPLSFKNDFTEMCASKSRHDLEQN